MKTSIKNWWIWNFLRSGIFVAFLIFFGTIAVIAYIGEKRKNKGTVHVMQENVLYVRPEGFKELGDSINLKEVK